MKRTTKKIQLKSKTSRTLEAATLAQVAGGASTEFCIKGGNV